MAIKFRGAVSGSGASALTVTVTLPTGFQTGDFCVIGGRVGNTTAVFTTPAGWTIINTANDATGGYSYCFYFRVLQAGDANPVLTSTVAGLWVWVSEALFSTTGTPLAFDAQGTEIDTGVTGSTFVPPAATGGTNDGSIIIMVGRNSASVNPSGFTDTPAAGWTTGADIAVPTGSAANTRIAAIYYQLGVSGTVTPGTFTFTLTGVSTTLFFSSQQVLVRETLTAQPQPRPAARRKLSRAYVQFTPVRTTNASGTPPPSGQVQPWATVPVPRRRPARAVWRSAAVPGQLGQAPRQAPYLPPRRKPGRAVVQFIPVVTVNATPPAAVNGTIQPLTARPAPRRTPARAYIRFVPVTTTNAPPPVSIPPVIPTSGGDRGVAIRVFRSIEPGDIPSSGAQLPRLQGRAFLVPIPVDTEHTGHAWETMAEPVAPEPGLLDAIAAAGQAVEAKVARGVEFGRIFADPPYERKPKTCGAIRKIGGTMLACKRKPGHAGKHHDRGLDWG